ncbi:MAG: glycosyltransferase [Sphingomonas sp.]|uniref:glycosyltransferase n=1 Tax=Sphingomonas sp. TaxID=28214 RepID=UPI0025DA4E27|nr:glycosyltransferase [Sphingomonas sp.]MBY0284971.1 glycosyltransferase [Sphingomonas sp.]
MLRVLTLSTLFPDATRPNFGVFVERQTLGLSRLPGVEVRVVAPIGVPPWPLSGHARYRAFAEVPTQETWRELDVRRPRFVNLPGTGGRFHAGALVRRLKPLLAEVRRDFAFDVIDAEFFFPDGPAAVALGSHFGVPVSIKARGADIHLWGQGATAAQVRRAGLAADGMLAVSAAMKADMVALGMPEDRIAVHHTGVDAARFGGVARGEAKAALDIDGPIVMSLGALVPRKGHDIVVGAVAALREATLLIIGEGPERAKLEAQIAALGLGDRVRLLGAVPHAEMGRLLPAADVMALASASEGLANAWVEALACGVPIVIPDIGGAREVLTDPAFGLIAARNPVAFAEAIGMLIAVPPLPERVKQGAARFSWETNAAALKAHLEALAAVT